MQIGFFVIPVAGEDDAQTELNRFLRSVRLVSLDKLFVPGEGGGTWSVA